MIYIKPLRILKFIAIILLGVPFISRAQMWNPGHAIGTIGGHYSFSYNQTPEQLVELSPPGISFTGFTYQWEQSSIPIDNGTNFSAIPNATATSYTIPIPFTQTMYYRRKTYSSPTNYITSNIIKIQVVSVNWEDNNYIREHAIATTAVTDWQTVDQLAIGPKLQTTTYLDGLGRSVEKVSRETATPATGNTLWGDVVQFSQYDAMGRETQHFLPYTTTTESGKFKSAPGTEQPQYYTNTYNETSAFDAISFENNPLNRVSNVKESGSKWATSLGNSAMYDLNGTPDNVQIWSVDYIQGDAPVNRGAYPAGSLYKLIYTDVNNAQVVEYTNKAGQLILKKVQIDNVPTAAHAGWICTYSVYDDFGLLRFMIQPEGVKYLDANNWSFAGTNGQTVLAEQCFQYNYDDKGRTIWKKKPGAIPLNMLYDIRDRVVFMQDGNQANLPSVPPQWTTNLYDELDRPVMTVLYNTPETPAALQADINNAVTVTTVTIPAHVQAPANLSYDSRQAGVSLYVASNSISFISDAGGSFQSGTNDQFVAQIDPSPSSPAYTGTATTLSNPISAANLANTAVSTVVKYWFYDNYSFNGVKGFDNNFTNTTAYSNTDPNVQPITPSSRTTNMLTGTLTRALGTNVFLAATTYFDEKGRHIQSLEDNIKTGVDITTIQYHFNGHILSTCSSHSAPGTGYTAFIVLNKNIFDKLGRVTSLQKQFGSNAFKTIASYDYDDIGRMKIKHLDPNYNNPNSGNPDLESLVNSYNIHNQLIGINKDYALKAPATYNKWGHFFGMYLGFDNKDNVFNVAQLNGKITGQQWNTQGDDAQRKNDYTYDNAGRLINAAYNEQQHPGDGWSNGKMDFSVSGTSGQITYDLNGNLLTMLQKGIIPGTSAPITIDDLRYTYNLYSNKLQSVTDQMTTPTVNGLFGDFKDGTNAAGTADYVYDNNGNVVIDLNKNAQSLNNGASPNGISYNYLDKPEQIRIVGKGTIKILYNADGEKLQRIFIPESGAVASITTYIKQFNYQETAPLTLSSTAPYTGTSGGLAFINFEEGRVRVMTPVNQSGAYSSIVENGNFTLPNGKMGVWDYFIRDYEKNVRMILTEEIHTASNTCTMESSRASIEDPIFGQTGGGNEVEATRWTTPAGWQSTNSSSSVSRLGNIFGHTIGPNTLQKVMAGDLVTASAQYYFQTAGTNSNPNIIPNILNSLAGALGGSSTAGTLVHGNVSPITNQLSNTPGFVNAVEPSNATTGAPQAYLTILFFDERFNFIAAADGGVQQQQVASSWTASNSTLGLGNIKAPKNGYVFVYVSNRSDQDVYFDNLSVGIAAGNIIEENHYYAYGLKIAGISSKKLGDAAEGTLKNGYLYNGKELLDDADLNWYDYGYRNYDPQIGRFPQIDPIAEEIPTLSSYQYAFDDPIGNIDKDGLIGGIACPGTSAFSIFLGNVGTAIYNGIPAISGALQYISIGINITNTAVHVESSILNSSLINGQLTTIGANISSSSGPGDPVKPKVIPIFWEELWYPAIEEIDYEYSNMPSAVIKGQVLTLKQYPNVRFLIFHYEKNQGQSIINGKAARDANKNVINPNSKIFDLHEVPYKSTKEGGFYAIMRPAPANQNGGHGGALAAFYARYNMQDGDMFLVPLYYPNLAPKTVPQVKPAPFIKYNPEYPVPRIPVLIPEAEEIIELEELEELGELILLFSL